MIEVKSLVKIYATVIAPALKAVDRVSFNVEEGRFIPLLGLRVAAGQPLLSCIAGLEKADAGEILVAGQKVFPRQWFFVPAYRRPIGMVFQSYAIWPHMTVFENVAFPLRVGKQRSSRRQVKRKGHGSVGQWSCLVKCRMARTCLVVSSSACVRPRAGSRAAVLLLDEPLSNLDAKLASRCASSCASYSGASITSFYVTHDQIEALSMSNVIAVMNSGVMFKRGPA